MTPPKKKAAVKPKPKPKPTDLPVPPLGEPMPHSRQIDFGLGTEVTVLFPLIDVDPPAWHLTPFSGLKTRCAKCGLGDQEEDRPVAVIYHASVMVQEPCWRLYTSQEPGSADKRTDVPFPEHLDRRCPVCQFGWVESLAADFEMA